MKNIIIVTAAVIFNSAGEVLISQRKKVSHKALKWEFPGGTLEPNESPEDCIIREIFEELAIKINVIDIYKVVLHRYPEKNVLLLVYQCQHISGNLKIIDCNDARWVKLEDLNNYDFAEADLPVVEKILKTKKNNN